MQASQSRRLGGLRLRWFDRGLELWQVETKLSLHTSKRCSSQTVSAHVVCSHGGKVFNGGFGNGLGASGTTEETVRLGVNAH